MLELNENKQETLSKVFNEKWNKWVEKYSILENNDVLSWLVDLMDHYTDQGKDAKNFKIVNYMRYLQQYCDYFDCNNPSELIEEKIDSRNSRVKKYLKELQNISLEDAKALNFTKIPSEESIRNAIQGTIKGFYSNRGQNISYGLDTVQAGANVNEIYVNREILKQIQGKLESMGYRLVNKFESQTGLRINDVLTEIPKYKIEKFQDHYFIRNFKAMKENVVINFLFFTQELSELIQSAYPKQKLTELNLNKLFMTRMGKRINQNNYLRRLKALIKDLGIEGNIKTHSMRKYFESRTIDANIEGRFRLHLMGAKPNYRDAVYDNNLRNIEWVYKKWLKVEEAVCVDCIIVDKTSEEVKVLKQENFELRTDMANMNKQMQENEKAIETIKNLFNTFIGKVDPKKFKGLLDKTIEKAKREGKAIEFD